MGLPLGLQVQLGGAQGEVWGWGWQKVLSVDSDRSPGRGATDRSTPASGDKWLCREPGSPASLPSAVPMQPCWLRGPRGLTQASFVHGDVICKVPVPMGLYVWGWPWGNTGCPGGSASLGWEAQCPTQPGDPGVPCLSSALPAPRTPRRARALEAVVGPSGQAGFVRLWTLPCHTRQPVSLNSVLGP